MKSGVLAASFQRLVLYGIVAFASLGACTMGIDKSETGTVKLTIGGAVGSRTIVPDIDVEEYRVSFSGPATVDPVVLSGTTLSIDLAAGTWTISVEGLDSGGGTIARGSRSGVSVSAGATTSISIVLSPVSSGTGTIDVTVTWPATVSPAIDGYTAVLTVDDVEASPGTVTFDAANRTLRYVRGTEVVPDAEYLLKIELFSGAQLRTGIYESVLVFDNVSTYPPYALTEADFDAPPAAPASLSASEATAGVALIWADSTGETAYTVERSVDGVAWTVLSDTLPANTTEYADASAAAAQSYRYRVSAANSIGLSLPSPEAIGVWGFPVPGGAGALNGASVSASTFSLSWTAAADETSAAPSLEYLVVRSGSDNIGTVAAALANGTVVQNWTAAAASATASGLSSGTYWFNVLVRDAAGNAAAYVPLSVSFGSLLLTITVETPQDVAIDFDIASDPVIAQTADLQVSVTNTYESYKWYLDGALVPGETAQSIVLPCSGLSVGTHRLTALVKSDGLYYSSTFRFSVKAATRIVVDHTSVELFDDIPDEYLAAVKKMWLDVPGESHARGYRRGLELLAAQYPKFAVSLRDGGTPEAYTDQHLRASSATWGDVGIASGWQYWYGEEDWFTSALARTRTRAHLDYAHANGLSIAAMGFVWCWDMSWINGAGGGGDAEHYGVRWAGSSEGGPEGNLRWGLNAADQALTGNSVSMDTYLAATQEYADYSASQGYPTRVFLTTGPVDHHLWYGLDGENELQREVKHDYIRAYAAADESRILFDYADVLAWSDAGVENSGSWNGHAYQLIHSDNLLNSNGTYGASDDPNDHIGDRGALRVGKALWVLLARMAGWEP